MSSFALCGPSETNVILSEAKETISDSYSSP
jgi:hypothetical protein